MRKEIKKFFVFLLIIFSLVLLSAVFIGKGRIEVIEQAITNYVQGKFRLIGWISFIFLYVLGGLFIWSLKDPLKLIGAFVFGSYISTLLIYISEIINAYVLFYFSRRLGKDFVEYKLKKKKWENLYEKVGNIGFVMLVLLRAIILIPYRMLDLVFGLTNISLRKYICAVILGSLPRIFIVQYSLVLMKGFAFDYNKLIIYFQNNPQLVVFFISYYILMIILAVMLRRRFR